MFSWIGGARGRVFAVERAFRVSRTTPTTQGSFHFRAGVKRCVSQKANDKHNVFVTCLPGLEPLLSQEMHALKIPNTASAGGVSIRDMSVENILNCHLYLGCASHLYIRCGQPFDVRGFSELLRKVAQFPWENFISPNVTAFDFRVTSSKSKLTHTGAVAERVENGILKRLDRPTNYTPHGPPEKATIIVRIHRDTVTLSIDTSETPIHRRGYRLETGKAPLREDIAFAMLYGAGLRPEYHKDEKEIGFSGLVDPFCGSGTLPIEGAAMMVGLPPGRLREAPLKTTRFYDPKEWEKLVAQSLQESEILIKNLETVPRISASDRDEGAVESTKRNAERAGVIKYMDIQTQVLANNPWILNSSVAPMDLLVATNPPFGRRISTTKSGKEYKTRDHLLPLYQSIGHKIKTNLASPGRHLAAVILNHNVDMVRRTGLPSLHANFTTDHGGLKVASVLSPDIMAFREVKQEIEFDVVTQDKKEDSPL